MHQNRERTQVQLLITDTISKSRVGATYHQRHATRPFTHITHACRTSPRHYTPPTPCAAYRSLQRRLGRQRTRNGRAMAWNSLVSTSRTRTQHLTDTTSESLHGDSWMPLITSHGGQGQRLDLFTAIFSRSLPLSCACTHLGSKSTAMTLSAVAASNHLVPILPWKETGAGRKLPSPPASFLSQRSRRHGGHGARCFNHVPSPTHLPCPAPPTRWLPRGSKMISVPELHSDLATALLAELGDG